MEGDEHGAPGISAEELRSAIDADIALDKMHVLVETERACLVIGAGVSVSLASNAESKRLVTWRGFLDQLAKTVANMFGLEHEWYLRVKALLYGSVDGGIVHLGKAAEMIEHFVTTANMGAAHTHISPYARYHHLVFKILHAIRADKNSPLASIIHRLKVPIFTTNYDVLLEDATGRFTLSIDDLLRAQRQYRLAPQQHPLADHQLYVFHLHGLFYDDPERKFCLTKREYAITIDDFLLALKPVLIDNGSISGSRIETVHRSMIFIGLAGSLQDIHFTSLFSALYEHNVYLEHMKMDTIKHYVLITSSESSNILKFHFVDSLGNSIPAESLLIPVVYGSSHEDLPRFLNRLLQKTQRTRSRSPIPKASGRGGASTDVPALAAGGAGSTTPGELRTSVLAHDGAPNPHIRFHGGSVDIAQFKDAEAARRRSRSHSTLPLDSPNPESPSAWALPFEQKEAA